MDRGLTASEEDLVEYVFHDIKARRAGILKALTADFEDFHQQCDPAKENLCLYGFPDEHWEVNLPADEVPPEIPEPVLGINFARDGTNKKDWLSLVAIHSDAWLNALASYFGGRFQFDRTQSTDMWILGTYLCRRRICRQHSWTCVLRPSATSLSSDRPFFLTFCCCFARTRISGFWFDLWVWSQISDPSPFRVLICQGFFSSALGHPGI
ncbi:PHD finger protein ALFIN-LIKE 9 isoform X3 [Musa acuminata AAA Group]|uniref:PHD finger protein ALFIN-LIKE 9 isoform X3 n=1 Tax=Musa acuminata AAA Group TaxID=214697 RepID=UPI0031E213F8